MSQLIGLGREAARYHAMTGLATEETSPEDDWTRQPNLASHEGDAYLVLFGYEAANFSAYGLDNGVLAGRFLLESCSSHLTTSPWTFEVLAVAGLAGHLTNDPAPIALVAQTAAQDAVAQIRHLSGLTNEEIAPLAGVSRRSLQAWIAGEHISARKEQRLLALLTAIQQLASDDPQATRRRLLERAPGGIRPYDLLAEERFDQAVHLALKTRTATSTPASPQAHDLIAQIAHVEDGSNIGGDRLNRSRSRPMR
jgi:DNA-binding transcriptional regulator YiaG